ncbi:MAG: PD40 domain-containing protein [Thermoflexales bacterium]|nr:PD40 domain-containing protein [Thermoflexales bacterium]
MSRIWLWLCLSVMVLSACASASRDVVPAVTNTPLSSTVMPTSTPIVSAPTATPPVVAASTVAPTVIDLSRVDVRYRDRAAWQTRLGWPDDCETTFTRTAPHEADSDGGVRFYALNDGRFLAVVTCALGPYWVEERLYLYDPRTTPPTAMHLTVPELTPDDIATGVVHEVDQIQGSFPTFNPYTQSLTNLVAFRGPKDCGWFYRYRFEHDRWVLAEARYHACDDAQPVFSDQWPVVYPRPEASGPYLLYQTTREDGVALISLNADGSERAVRLLPAGASVPNLAQAVSPDGKWLAFYTGSTETNFDLTLNLMDMTTGQTQPLAVLLAPDYPANFLRAAEEAAQQGRVIVENAPPSVVASFLLQAFANGIQSLAWSPDGRYLAFAGQMDGLSSDLYVYDQTTRLTTRLTDGLEHIQSITWSPDGRWIVHGSAYTRGQGMPVNYYAAAPDDTGIKSLPGSLTDILGWTGPAAYVFSHANNGLAGQYYLQQMAIDTGRLDMLWGGTFTSFAIDPAQAQVAITGYEAVGASGPAALYLVDLTGRSRQIAAAVSWVQFLGVGDKRFVYETITGETRQTRYLLADGSTLDAGFVADRVSVSPDGRYVLAIGAGLQVVGVADGVIRPIELPATTLPIGPVLWRPDSAGFFFTIGSDLYAVAVSGGKADRVGTGRSNRPFDAVWIGLK